MATKMEMFTAIENIITNGETGSDFTILDVLDWVKDQKTKLANKKSSNNEKQKAETAERVEKVYNALAEMENPVSIPELQKLTTDEEVASYSTNRLVALLTKLGDRIVREKIKGIMHYSIA